MLTNGSLDGARAVRRARWWVVLGLVSSLACGGSETSGAESEEEVSRGAAEGDAPRDSAPRESSTSPAEGIVTPGSRVGPNAAGCTGTCLQICQCLAAACTDAARTGCASAEQECSSSCQRSSCRSGDPVCWRLPPESAPLPGEPEPPPPRPEPPGPGPDPLPIDSPDGNASASDGSGSAASSSGQSYGAGTY
jgi:hypothetical protein